MLSEVIRADVVTTIVETGRFALVVVKGFSVGTSVVIAKIVVLTAVAVPISVSSVLLDTVTAPV